MNTKTIYVLVTVLAIFTLGAMTIAPASEAANNSGVCTYQVYVEIVEPNGVVSDHVTVEFKCAPNNADFAEAATAAFEAKGINLVFSESSYGMTLSYNGDLNIACWVADGNEWVTVTDTSYQYVESSCIGLAVKTGYIDESVYNALPDSEKADWVANEWGAGTEWAYMKCPGISPSDVKDSLANGVAEVSIERAMWCDTIKACA